MTKKTSPESQITELLRRASYYSDYGLPIAAIEMAEKGLKLAEEVGAVNDQADFLLSLAQDHAFLLATYKESEVYAEQTLKLASQLPGDQSTRIATAYSVLGFTAAQRGRHARAVWALEHMRDILRPLMEQPPAHLTVQQQRTVVRLYVNLGAAYSMANQILQAQSVFEEGLAFARAAGNEIGTTLLLMNLGELETILGEYDHAHERLSEAKALILSSDFPDKQALLSQYYQTSAQLCLRRGDVSDAWDHAVQAADAHMRELFSLDRTVIAETNELVGLIYLALGEDERANECLRRASRIYRELGQPNKADRLYLHLATHRIQHDLVSAPHGSGREALKRAGLNLESERRFILINQLLDFLFSMYDQSSYTVEHCTRVTRYAMSLAQKVGGTSEQLDAIAYVGPLHDLGKMTIPPEVLDKPGALTAEERATMQRHPEVGLQLLKRVLDLTDEAASLLRHHHERWDGTGYPDGLASSAIPLPARIMAVADAYDAMTSDRPYRGALSHAEAMRRLRGAAGSQFDLAVVEAWHALHEVPDDYRHVDAW